MILTVVIGNTNTRLCWFVGKRIVRREIRRTTEAPHLNRYGHLTGAAIASVVPEATPRWMTELKQHGINSPLIITPRTHTGMLFRYRRTELGADRVCAAVGALRKSHSDVIVVDFGTAITVNVIAAEGVFIGGYILPGPDAMLELLHQTTAQLPRVHLRSSQPDHLPQSTTTAINAGVVNAVVAAVERIINQVKDITARNYNVILTGGRATWFAPLLAAAATIDPDLSSFGLAAIYELNLENR